MSFKSRYPLESKSGAAGGNAIFDLTQLPDDARLAGIMLEIIGTGTTASSTQAVTPKILAQLLATVDLDSEFYFLRATGRMLYALYKHMNGVDLGGSQSVTATDAGVSMRSHIWIPMTDKRASNPNDFSIPTKLLNNKTLNCNFKNSLVLDLANDVTMSNLMLRAVAHLIPSNGDVLPIAQRIVFEDWSALQGNLQPGYVSHMGIMDESDLSVTPEQYAQITLASDGQTLIDRQLANQLIADYNQAVARSSADVLDAQPTAGLDFIPLITAPEQYKVTQLIRAERGFRADIDSGTATGARYYYRALKEVGTEKAMVAAAKLGRDISAEGMSVKTKSGNEISGSPRRMSRHARILPKRVGP